jgi:hypothetical protein
MGGIHGSCTRQIYTASFYPCLTSSGQRRFMARFLKCPDSVFLPAAIILSAVVPFSPVTTRRPMAMAKRMSMRRFTRLTNAFSKKVENHEHSVAIHYMHYNFCRIHQTLRVTPAMEAGIADHVWELEEIVGLL